MVEQQADPTNGYADDPIRDREAVETSCLYPGTEPVVRRGARSGAHRRDRSAGLQFRFSHLDVTVHGDLARLTCVETVVSRQSFAAGEGQEPEFSKLAVTSILARTACAWKLWHHQTGPVSTHLGLERS